MKKVLFEDDLSINLSASEQPGDQKEELLTLSGVQIHKG